MLRYKGGKSGQNKAANDAERESGSTDIYFQCRNQWENTHKSDVV